MTGEASWLTSMIFLVGAAALVALWFFGVQMARYYGWHRTKVVCPASGATVDVTVVTEDRSGRVVDVSRCAAFNDPNHVRCQKRCIERANAGRVPTSG